MTAMPPALEEQALTIGERVTTVLPVELGDGPFAIETHGLVKRYRGFKALNKLELQVPEGSVTLFIGPNGAGKSTAIKILMDLVSPTDGKVTVLGLDAQKDGPLVRANVGYVPEQLDWGHSWMKVGRLLEHHAAYFPSWDAQYARHLSDAFSLRLDQRMRTLSKGQGRRVHLVLALAHRPPVLVLDEPTDGLDPVMRDGVMQALIAHVADTPTTMLISTHHAGEMERIADCVSVVKNGQLCAQLRLDALHRGLRRYVAGTPDGWNGAPNLNACTLRKINSRGAIDWTVWGDEANVVRELGNSGAVVRSATRLTLSDAALALLAPGMMIR